MKIFFNILYTKPTRYILVGCIFSTIILSLIAYLIGNLFLVYPAFTISIVFGSWFGSKKAGYILSIFTIGLSVFVLMSLSNYNFSIIDYLIFGFTHLFFYLILSTLVTNFRKAHRFETLAADTDDLTGLLNSRSFYEHLQIELKRSRRYKSIFSLAYIDIDNFKDINDTYGHPIGDSLLIEVGNILRSNLRDTDSIGRLGGDEFSCLFPETNQQNVINIFTNLIPVLRNSMKENKWYVSFSIGVVTFNKLPKDITTAIREADSLMYSVKNNKKNNIQYIVI